MSRGLGAVHDDGADVADFDGQIKVVLTAPDGRQNVGSLKR